MPRNYRKEHEIACQALEVAKDRASNQYDIPKSVIIFKKVDKNGRLSVGFKDYSSGDNFKFVPKKDIEAMGIDINALPEYTAFSQEYQRLKDQLRNYFYRNREVTKKVFYDAKTEYLRRFYSERREIYDSYMSSPKWSAKRQECFQIHGTTCVDCRKFRATDIHHLHYETLGDEDPLNDIVPLCSSCHEARHSTGGV